MTIHPLSLSSARSRSRCSAFTLIELLVVVAIIGIITAILFPVFARSREKARQVSCVSNLRQLSLSILQYIQDNDETVPMVEYTVDGAAAPNEYFTWARVIQPYAKNWSILRCPDAEHDPRGAWQNPTDANFYHLQSSPSYGYNYNGLNPWQPCLTTPLLADDHGLAINAGPPVNLSQIQEPSRTVLLTDVKLFGDASSAPLASDFCRQSGGRPLSHGLRRLHAGLGNRLGRRRPHAGRRNDIDREFRRAPSRRRECRVL